jgi:hypothetical protein
LSSPTSAFVAAPLALAACGDALLPSDYSGPPTASVNGDVVASRDGSRKDADRPQLSLEWLTTLAEAERPGGDRAQARSGDALAGQLVTFSRSPKLATDWEIGLASPRDDVKLSLPVAASAVMPSNVHVGIAKLVYFDDRIPDARLDWSCATHSCDEVKAVSDEFVVYLDRPLACSSSPEHRLHPAFAAGYHYFAVDAGGGVRKLSADDPLHFTVADRTPIDGDPTRALRDFAPLLKRTFALALIDHCLEPR